MGKGDLKRIATIFLALFCCVGAAGQDAVWSLEQCIDYACSHSASVLLAAAQLKKSRAQLAQSVSELLPSLSLYANQYYNWGRSVDMQELVIVRNRLTRQTSASVGASFSIFDGFARLNTVAANRALASAAKDNLKQAVLEVKADIARAYLGCVLSTLSCQRLKERQESIVLQTERTRVQQRLGERTQADILELEAKAADIRSQIAEAEAEAASQMSRLRQLTGCGQEFRCDCSAVASESFGCHEPDFMPPDGTWTGAGTAAWNGTAAGTEADTDADTDAGEDAGYLSPKVAAAREAAKAAGYALKAARGAMMPSLSISAAYGSYYSDAAAGAFKEQIDGNRNPSVTLSLVIPVFDGGLAAAKVAQARAEKKLSEIRLRQAEEETSMELEQMQRQCRLLLEQERTFCAREELCRERMHLCDKEYELGTISSFEWLEASDNLAQSELERIQCRCKYLFQLKLLQFYYDGWQR